MRGLSPFWVAMVALAWSQPAAAYLLPTESVVRLLAENRQAVTARDVTLQLNADLEGHDHQVDERLYYKRADRARLVQQDDTVTVVVEREGQSAAGEDRALRAVATPTPNLLAWLLFPRGKEPDEMAPRLLRGLQTLGVDTKVVALGRLGETVAYILGANPWEGNKAQLWLDKTSYAPIRVIVPSVADGKTTLYETRLLEYGYGPAGNGLPRLFEDYIDGKLQRRAEVVAAQFNQDLPETLFDWAGRRR